MWKSGGKTVVFHFEKRIIDLYVMTNSRLRPFRQIYWERRRRMDDPTAPFEFLGLTFWLGYDNFNVAGYGNRCDCINCAHTTVVDTTGKRQNLIEYLLDFTNNIVDGQLPQKQARQFGLYAFTLFFFIIVANEMGMLLQFAGAMGWLNVKFPDCGPDRDDWR